MLQTGGKYSSFLYTYLVKEMYVKYIKHSKWVTVNPIKMSKTLEQALHKEMYSIIQ